MVLSLAEARAGAIQNLVTIRSGGDPRSLNARKRVPTLRQVVESVIETRRTNWKNPSTEQQFRHLFEGHVFPTLADRSVDAIQLPDVLAILKPIWGGRGSQGYTLRQHLSGVMRYAVAHGHRADDPASKGEGPSSEGHGCAGSSSEPSAPGKLRQRFRRSGRRALLSR